MPVCKWVMANFNGFANKKITRFQGIREHEIYTFSRYSSTGALANIWE